MPSKRNYRAGRISSHRADRQPAVPATETPREKWNRENRALGQAAGRAAQKAALTHAQLIARMAGTIVDLAAANDNCSEADLVAAGFSAEEIARYRGRAVLQAARVAPGLRGVA